ncbi:RDD family protein [Jeotgalibacillus sp. ET6]|uniref:RDD family protein n=1 Tax=Jeotgalibacillus sp. ET6 TaxID=3037260 RepID=UPI00241889CB|nr:RDD family protein [Jeotgalibacillus sp. ET6]MDG5472329.1 RDD family protein [Jeotgalibacillus sp. ET6]
MESITKKRTKAILIDLAISSVVTAGVEYLLRKKVKNELVHTLVTPTVVMWGLEYAQLHCGGQTIGYKKMGIALESEEGSDLTTEQIFKRLLYRDTKSTLDLWKNRSSFEGEAGAVLPHDVFAGTIVRER